VQRIKQFLVLSLQVLLSAGSLAGSLEYKYSYGFTLAHRKVMMHYYERHYGIHELAWTNGGGKYVPWKKDFHYPRTGLGFIFSSMGQTTLIGNSYAVYPFLSFERGKKIKRCFRVGSGLGYISRPFNRETNYKNIAIGSHFNAFIRLEQGVIFPLNKRLLLGTGISLSHFSNGATRTPNLGINVLTAHVSLRWIYRQDAFTDSVSTYYPFSRWMVLPSAGYKEIYPAGGPSYGVFNLAVQRNFSRRKKGNFFVGSDVFYSSSLRAELMADNDPGNDGNPVFQCGIHGGYQFTFHRFSIPLLMGFYAFDRVKRNGSIYQSLALRYRISPHCFTQITLKCHKAKAEYATFGIGYSL
jgi:hypothetical protein